MAAGRGGALAVVGREAMPVVEEENLAVVGREALAVGGRPCQWWGVVLAEGGEGVLATTVASGEQQLCPVPALPCPARAGQGSAVHISWVFGSLS